MFGCEIKCQLAVASLTIAPRVVRGIKIYHQTQTSSFIVHSYIIESRDDISLDGKVILVIQVSVVYIKG